MKPINMILVFLFLFISSLHAEEVTLANGEWSPFLSERLPHYGYASHIVTEAFRLEGIAVKYKFYPWARAIKYVESGQMDGSLVWTRTSKREKFAYFSDTVIVLNQVLFHLKSRLMEWENPKDLRGITIGVPLGSALGFWKEPVEEHVVILKRTQTIKNGFAMLLKGRIDAFPLIDSVGYHLLRTQFTPSERSRITHSSPIIERYEYHLLLSKAIKSNAQIIQQFNRGLKRLKGSDKHKEMEKDFYAGKYD